MQEIGAKKSAKNSNAEVKRTQKAIFMVKNIKKTSHFYTRLTLSGFVQDKMKNVLIRAQNKERFGKGP